MIILTNRIFILIDTFLVFRHSSKLSTQLEIFDKIRVFNDSNGTRPSDVFDPTRVWKYFDATWTLYETRAFWYNTTFDNFNATRAFDHFEATKPKHFDIRITFDDSNETQSLNLLDILIWSLNHFNATRAFDYFYSTQIFELSNSFFLARLELFDATLIFDVFGTTRMFDLSDKF